MGLLIYNHTTDRYEGTRIAVPRALFTAYVAKLVAGGMRASMARGLLLYESTWAEDTAGIELLGT